jgi:hypothetical protein
MWKDLASPTFGFDAEPSLAVECLNNLSLCHLYSGNMHLAVQELEGLIREDPCLYLTEDFVRAQFGWGGMRTDEAAVAARCEALSCA